MPRTAPVFPDVATAQLLTALEHHQLCPAKPGIYAAWIKDRAGLAAAGIDGPPPRLMYVGISARRERGGLHTRLGQHVEVAFQPMNELLAARGVVLGGWGYRVLPPQTGRMARTTPLLDVAWSQTLAWQHQHFLWAWQPCTSARARLSEIEAIRLSEIEAIQNRAPLLNMRHTTDGLPPQLRAGTRYERARARWLWQISWAALLVGDPPLRSPFDLGRWRDQARNGNVRIAVDELGFPMPLDEAASARAIRTVPRPDFDEIWDMMVQAAARAPLAVRHALGQGCDDDTELDAWWASHAGAPYLPKPVSVQTAIAQSLTLASEERAACPARLPNDERVHELSKMLDMLDGVTH
jgi:hypothetical protein